MSWILYRGLAVGRSKRTYELTSSIVPRGTPFDRLVELEFPPIAFDPERPSCCSTYSGPSGYCVKCQATRAMTDTKSIERGGGPALEGKCVVCGGARSSSLLRHSGWSGRSACFIAQHRAEANARNRTRPLLLP